MRRSFRGANDGFGIVVNANDRRHYRTQSTAFAALRCLFAMPQRLIS